MNSDNPVVSYNWAATLPSQRVDEMLHCSISEVNVHHTVLRYEAKLINVVSLTVWICRLIVNLIEG